MGRTVTSDICPQAYGADSDRPLGIPGEGLHNVVSARQLVGWYNGLPDCRPPLDLDVEHVVIVGMGNVALDVLRLLTAPIDLLKVREEDLSPAPLWKTRNAVPYGQRIWRADLCPGTHIFIAVTM